jgi:hypothetical protein
MNMINDITEERGLTGTASMPSAPRIAIIGGVSRQASERACLMGVAAAFGDGARLRGMPVRFVLAVTLQDPDDDDEIGMPIRGWAWEALDEQACRRALFYAGGCRATESRLTAGTHVVVDDGIRHLCDCDAWIFADPRSPAPVLPLRPFLLVVGDDLHHVTGGLAAEELRVVGRNLAAARVVLVWSEEMQRDVIDFYRVQPDRVRLVPRPAVCVDEPAIAAAGGPEAGFVWFVPDVVAIPDAAPVARQATAVAARPVDPAIASAYGEALAALL